MAIKTFEDFANEVKEKLPEAMGGKELEFNIQKAYKPGKTLTGITPFLGAEIPSPVIYLESYYDMYLDGEDLSNCVEKISLAMEEAMKFEPPVITEWFSWENVKDSIRFTLTAKSISKEMLEHFVHVPFKADLYKVFHIEIKGENTKGCVKVTESLLKQWGVSLEELEKTAMENMLKLGHTIKPLFSVIMDMMGEEIPSDLKTDENLLAYLGENENAGIICYPEYLEEIRKRIGQNYVIIPSSIYEVIILPLSMVENFETVNDMIRSVNEAEVEPSERLSDHAYLYVDGDIFSI